MFKDNLLENKRILITGGGTGLGKEMATHFAMHGAELYICGRRENVLSETAAEISETYGTKVNYQTLDIRASKDVDDYIEFIFDTFLQIISLFSAIMTSAYALIFISLLPVCFSSLTFFDHFSY